MSGENGCVSETESSAAEPLLDTDTVAADDADDDDARRQMSQAEVKVKAVDSVLSDRRDSRHQLDVAEQQSAALYVSHLSQFIATLVSSATSSLDADRLLQDFSSTFCTGRTGVTSTTGRNVRCVTCKLPDT